MGTSQQIESEPTPTPETQSEPGGEVQATATPIILHKELATPTPLPSTPTPTPTVIPSIKPKPKKIAYGGGYMSYCKKNPKAMGCCVQDLKNDGDLPKGKVTKDGFARTIPTEKIEVMKPGDEMVIKTKESSMGHVLKVKINDKGEAVSINEGGHPVGEGRIVPKTVIVGEVKL